MNPSRLLKNIFVAIFSRNAEVFVKIRSAEGNSLFW